MEKAWTTPDDTLIFQFQSLEKRLQALKAKKKVLSFLEKIYLNEDLTRLQMDELHKDYASILATRKENKWPMIRNG